MIADTAILIPEGSYLGELLSDIDALFYDGHMIYTWSSQESLEWMIQKSLLEALRELIYFIRPLRPCSQAPVHSRGGDAPGAPPLAAVCTAI